MSTARERFQALAMDTPRERWFETLREAIAEYYLADPSNPFQQSGRSAGLERWELKRRCIADAVHRDGDFLDVGCANGLLLQSLIDWAAERGHTLRPYGVDFVPELVALARERHPEHEDSFETANAFYWIPRRQYDFVRISLENFRPDDQIALARRIYELAVAPGGRLIVCRYANPDEPGEDPARAIEGMDLDVVGRSQAPDVAIAWCDKPARSAR